jgi:hypothetical protein
MAETKSTCDVGGGKRSLLGGEARTPCVPLILSLLHAPYGYGDITEHCVICVCWKFNLEQGTRTAPKESVA